MTEKRSERPWDVCGELITAGNPAWRPYKEGADKLTHERTVTWVAGLVRCNLTDYAVEVDRRLRRSKLVTQMFRVSTLGILSSDDRHEYRQYYVFPDPSQTMLLDMRVRELKDPDARQEIIDMYNFALDNKFVAPNAEDLLRLDYALSIGRDDGVLSLE